MGGLLDIDYIKKTLPIYDARCIEYKKLSGSPHSFLIILSGNGLIPSLYILTVAGDNLANSKFKKITGSGNLRIYRSNNNIYLEMSILGYMSIQPLGVFDERFDVSYSRTEKPDDAIEISISQ